MNTEGKGNRIEHQC